MSWKTSIVLTLFFVLQAAASPEVPTTEDFLKNPKLPAPIQPTLKQRADAGNYHVLTLQSDRNQMVHGTQHQLIGNQELIQHNQSQLRTQQATQQFNQQFNLKR